MKNIIESGQLYKRKKGKIIYKVIEIYFDYSYGYKNKIKIINIENSNNKKYNYVSKNLMEQSKYWTFIKNPRCKQCQVLF